MGVGKTIGCGMSVVVNQVRTGVFLDSVVLMRISRELADFEGIEEVALMIGTPSNLAILESAGLLGELGRQAGGGDLVLAVRARDAAAAELAATEAQRVLDGHREPGAGLKHGSRAPCVPPVRQWQMPILHWFLCRATSQRLRQEKHCVLVCTS